MRAMDFRSTWTHSRGRQFSRCLRQTAYHGMDGTFRRGLASNLYATGAQDILVQRILRHAKAHVTRDCYIKVFDSTVAAAMERLQVQFEQLQEAERDSRQLEFAFAERFDQLWSAKILADFKGVRTG